MFSVYNPRTSRHTHAHAHADGRRTEDRSRRVPTLTQSRRVLGDEGPTCPGPGPTRNHLRTMQLR